MFSRALLTTDWTIPLFRVTSGNKFGADVQLSRAVKKGVSAMLKTQFFLFKIHTWCTQSETHKKKKYCARELQFPLTCSTRKSTVQCLKALCKCSGVGFRETKRRRSELSHFIQTTSKSYLFFTGWRKQTPLPCQVAEGREDDPSSCRFSQYEKEYDPRSEQNERDRRSVHPVSHCAARLDSPFREALGEWRPSRSHHGAVWKAPGGDGGNRNEKAEKMKERERESRGEYYRTNRIRKTKESFFFLLWASSI